jgi:hypothetical protein
LVHVIQWRGPMGFWIVSRSSNGMTLSLAIQGSFRTSCSYPAGFLHALRGFRCVGHQ